MQNDMIFKYAWIGAMINAQALSPVCREGYYMQQDAEECYSQVMLTLKEQLKVCALHCVPRTPHPAQQRCPAAMRCGLVRSALPYLACVGRRSSGGSSGCHMRCMSPVHVMHPPPSPGAPRKQTDWLFQEIFPFVHDN